jgi:hypothetical protein
MLLSGIISTGQYRAPLLKYPSNFNAMQNA